MTVRDDLGRVLCCHGRPIACNECGDEYAAELSALSRPPAPTDPRIAAQAYFDKGRCSGHQQFNGRYCRDVAGPEQWCIHCAGFMLLQQLDALRAAREAQK